MFHFSILDNQRGSALVVALLMLVVLTLLGIAALTTTKIEVQISGNDKLYKTSFYAADAGTEMTGELIEQNIDERNWTNDYARGNVAIMNGSLYLNRDTDAGINPVPSDSNHDAVFPLSAVDTTPTPWVPLTNVPHTNIMVVGNSALSTGSAIQLAAGYEGKGKGAGGGGVWITYDVRAQHRNVRNSAAMVRLGWRHVM